MLNADATVHLLVGSADIGQGSETMECQIAAECLGIPLKSVQITAASVRGEAEPVITRDPAKLRAPIRNAGVTL